MMAVGSGEEGRREMDGWRRRMGVERLYTEYIYVGLGEGPRKSFHKVEDDQERVEYVHRVRARVISMPRDKRAK